MFGSLLLKTIRPSHRIDAVLSLAEITMNRAIVFAFIIALVVAVNGRVYYLQNADDPRDKPNVLYPIRENSEQSSRDLDLSFSAGDPEENLVHPVKKVYALVAPEKSLINVNKEIDRPISYYKFDEMPARRNGLEDILASERNPKLVKINGGKGDVVVELRVIANHDDI